MFYRHCFSTLLQSKPLEGFEIKWFTPAFSYAMLNLHTITKNAEAVVVVIKEFGPEVNADRTQYMVMSRD
jgi:hypothetical protein